MGLSRPRAPAAAVAAAAATYMRRRRSKRSQLKHHAAGLNSSRRAIGAHVVIWPGIKVSRLRIESGPKERRNVHTYVLANERTSERCMAAVDGRQEVIVGGGVGGAAVAAVASAGGRRRQSRCCGVYTAALLSFAAAASAVRLRTTLVAIHTR